MLYAGVDLHRRSLVVAIQDETGKEVAVRQFACEEAQAIREFFSGLGEFRAVIEASSSYRWLYELISPHGLVVLAHPYRLRAIVAGRAKTDKLDARMLARLLRAGLIPTAYIPPVDYQALRDLARARARLSREATHAKNELHALLGRANLHSPYANVFCQRGRRWIAEQGLAPVARGIGDELLRRLAHFETELVRVDAELRELSEHFPEAEALTILYGVGLYSALLIIGELGEPWRFGDSRQVGAYAGLTARVTQSGSSCRHGAISRQGSPWLRWILVEAAMKLVRRDVQLGNFYQRIRKRSGAKIARVAAARKLAEICWKRLMRWHREHPAA